MSLTLQTIPGFSDLADSVLVADNPAFGLHVAEISANAAFGMVRLECFQAIYKNGDTVPLPISPTDGYVYSREELLYIWTVRNSVNPSTNWISGPDCLWFCNWDVDQATGKVFSEEWYERSSTADSRNPSQSNDGSLLMFTIAQRQKTNIFMAATASFTAVSETTIATDKPLTQDMAQHLNDDAKFSVVGTEAFYLGEYVDGQTVSMPVSPIDGYTYGAAECKFLHAWRWTTSGAAYVQPPLQTGIWVSHSCDQLAPFTASIDSSGVCSVAVQFSYGGGESVFTPTGFGRIAAFAFCTRSGTPGSISPTANNFTEIDAGLFFPGQTLRASRVLAIKRNIDEAILTPEFFGPTDHLDGDTISLPTSLVDGYVYARSELQYVWSWTDTKNNLGGSHIRLPFFLGSIDPTTGVVALQTWRLPPGGPYVDDGSNGKISVIVMANRQAAHAALTDPTTTSTPADVTAFVTTGLATKELAIPSTTRGDFSLAHGLSSVPTSAWIQITNDGLIRFQTTRYDATNVYLNASDDGLTGYVILTYVANA